MRLDALVTTALSELEAVRPNAAAVQAFHGRHKMLLLACSPPHYSSLGPIAARGAGSLDEYAPLFREALTKEPSPGRLLNAFDHMRGYFEPEWRNRIGIVIDEYRQGRRPFGSVSALLLLAASSEKLTYLAGQSLLQLSE